MKKGDITPEMAAEMNRLRHEEGWTLVRIAEKFGCAHPLVVYYTDEEQRKRFRAINNEYVRKRQAKSKKKRFSPNWPEETKQRARDLREQGMSFNAIAKEIGCSPNSVRYWCDPKLAEDRNRRVREYYEDEENRKKHHEKMAEYAKERVAVDPEYLMQTDQRRFLRKRLIATGEYDILYELQSGYCPICSDPLPKDYKNGKLVHVDHKKPISHGGTNDLDNLQLTCAFCNLSKGNRVMDESA